MYVFRKSIVITQEYHLKPNTKIIWLVSANPKSGKSAERFENYFGSETIEEYFQRGGTMKDLRYDQEKFHLDLEGIPREYIDKEYSN